MKLNRGDVVLTRFPHASGARVKKRLAPQSPLRRRANDRTAKPAWLAGAEDGPSFLCAS